MPFTRLLKRSYVGMGAGLTALLALMQPMLASAEEGSIPYTLTLNPSPLTVTLGQPATLEVAIEAKAPLKLKQETPFKLVLSGDGIEPAQERWSAKDFEDPTSPRKVVKATFTPTQANAKTLSVALTFFICSDEACTRYRANPTVPLAFSGP